MTKQELKTGMTCESKNGNRYMIYECKDGVIDLIPIDDNGIDVYGFVIQYKKGLNSHLDIKSFTHSIEGFELSKVWHPESGLSLFKFRDEDLIWKL